jgi:ankyrin repeat protein
MKKKTKQYLKVSTQDFNKFTQSIREEDLDQIKYILSTTQNKLALLTATNNKGETPLHIAISKHINEDIVILPPTDECCYDTKVNVPLVKLLLEAAGEDAYKLVSAVDEDGNNIFHLATQIKYRSDIVPSHGIKDMDLIEAILGNAKIHPSIIIATVDKANNNPVHHALISGDSSSEIIKMFLELCGKHVAKVFGRKNDRGDTALHVAAYEAAPKSLELMLDALGEERARHKLCQKNIDGKTPLHLASDNTYGLCCFKTIGLILDNAGDKAKELVLATDNEGANILHSLLRYMSLDTRYNTKKLHKVIKLITEIADDDAATLITQEDNQEEKPLLMALPVKQIVRDFMRYKPNTTPEELIKIKESLDNDEEIYYQPGSSCYSYYSEDEDSEDSSLAISCSNEGISTIGEQNHSNDEI